MDDRSASQGYLMAGADWEAIKSIFGEALEVPPEDRSAFLRRVCEKDDNLFAALKDLIAIHEEESRRSREPASPPTQVFHEGELIAGRFRVIRFIASGGMGEVYEVADERLQLRVAMKTVRLEFASQRDWIARFQREIRVAREVWHKNLCRVFDLVEHGVSDRNDMVIPCLTMELLDGETLSSWLQRQRPLPLDLASTFARQIAAGLETLHHNGIIHRDLKPSNVMITRDRAGQIRPVVMDFGLAKYEARDESQECFESLGQFRAGAPFFMAPELMRGDGHPGVPSDIYALGLILDEMVTKTPAFPTSSMQALWFAKLFEEPLRPTARADALPAQWEYTILRCIDRDPVRRFARPSEVVAALEMNDGMAMPDPEPQVAEAALRPVGKSGSLFKRRWFVVGIVTAPAVAGASALTAIALQPVSTSIEVFDLENQTNDKQFDYFCRGTTNELMRRMTHLGGVRVIRLHSFRSNVPERAPSRFSLEGALQAYRGQIRLSILLTDNQDGSLVWSERFDRDRIGNPLEVQSDVAQGTATAISRELLIGRLGGTSQRNLLFPLVSRIRQVTGLQIESQLAKAPTVSNIALDLYMRGHNLLEEVTLESTRAAIDYMKQAVSIDRSFSLAQSALCDAHIQLMSFNYAPDPELLSVARDYAEQAVRNDSNLAEAYASLGAIQQMDWDWAAAEQSYRTALRLKPTFARARRWYAGLILQFGRFDETLKEGARAFEQDPYDRSAPATWGMFLFFSGKLQEAVSILAASVAGREATGARYNLAQCYARMAMLASGAAASQDYEKALSEAATISSIESRGKSPAAPGPSFADQLFALIHSLRGNSIEAAPYFKRVLEDMEAHRTSPVTAAWIYTAQQQYGAALGLLERAASWRDRRLLYVKVNPFLERLFDQPRFHKLIATMRL